MSGDYMRFPNTVEEFMDQYKIVDKEGIYMSKGAELVPIFRMNQWFEHERRKEECLITEQRWIPCSERLPEAKQRVLVTFPDGTVDIKICIDAGHLKWFFAHMIAWMPLPEPYLDVLIK